MPNLLEPSEGIRMEFVASPALDLLNAMYFTALAEQLEGVGEWPVQTRRRMDPALRGELDLLFSYPRHQPGIMGALNDLTFVHTEAWDDVEALIYFVREMPPEGDGGAERPTIQGLAIYSLRWPGHTRYELPAGLSARDALGAELDRGFELDLSCAGTPSEMPPRDSVLELFDRPEEVRARMLALIRRFYDEHYRADLDRRLPCMRRSVEHHRRDMQTDPEALLKMLTGRKVSCLQELAEDYKRFVFVPSVDLGPYNSCADLAPVHGLHYPCEAEFMGGREADAASTQRLALVYRALGDEQRLRILHLLRDGELYAQEIVDRTGLHQSVVSRHLAFMKAVELVNVRRQENRKFYSLNAEMRDGLRHAVEAMLPAASARSG